MCVGCMINIYVFFGEIKNYNNIIITLLNNNIIYKCFILNQGKN